jgi:hypothetical protein
MGQKFFQRSSSNKEGMCTFALKGVGLGCVATAEAVSFAPPRLNSPVAGRVRDDTHTRHGERSAPGVMTSHTLSNT